MPKPRLQDYQMKARCKMARCGSLLEWNDKPAQLAHLHIQHDIFISLMFASSLLPIYFEIVEVK